MEFGDSCLTKPKWHLRHILRAVQRVMSMFIDKTRENFYVIYDTKGCFAVHYITPEEATYKLCKVREIFVGTKGISHLVTHDVHSIHYSDSFIKVNDNIQIDLETVYGVTVVNLSPGQKTLLYQIRAPAGAGQIQLLAAAPCLSINTKL
ncbi:hypothetical protein GH733_019622 [Mirounga leonina]|nr:hypothetical protein GH733_019622 [Mirounga leonina]